MTAKEVEEGIRSGSILMGNDMRKLLAMDEQGSFPAGLHHVYIRHDDWCDALKEKGPCNCDPDITVRAQ